MDAANNKTGILFLCVANSARSQLAEGLARSLLGSRFNVFSAGSRPTQLNPFAKEVMSEISVDLSEHYAKPISAINFSNISYVVTLCEDEVCPRIPAGIKHFHWPHPDPVQPDLSSEEQLERFRMVRDQIRAHLFQLDRSIRDAA